MLYTIIYIQSVTERPDKKKKIMLLKCMRKIVNILRFINNLRKIGMSRNSQK